MRTTLVRSIVTLAALVAAPTLAGAQPAAKPPATGTVSGKVKAAPQGTTANSVVYLRGTGLAATPLKDKSIHQKGKQFTPPVMVVTQGTSVDFPNDDRIMHNVFSLSEGNAFDLGHYKKGESKTTTFAKPGVVDVYCNIHPNMVATVLVLDNDYYVHPNEDGTYTLPSVPVGSYDITVWTPNTKPVTKKVKVTTGTAKVDLQLPKATERLGEHNDKTNKPYGPGFAQ